MFFTFMFILVISSVLLGFGVLVTALVCVFLGEEQWEVSLFPGISLVKESSTSKAA